MPGAYERPTQFTKRASPFRAARRRAKRGLGKPSAAIHHAMDHKFVDGTDTTRAVRNRQHRAFWTMQGLIPPPMDAEGRPVD